jgi:hypothetical protein
MVRSVVAVIAGLIVTIVLVLILSNLAAVVVGLPAGGPPSTGYLALNLLGATVAGMAGGAAASRMAAHTPHGHVFALAAVILLLSLPGLFSAPAPGQPSWYLVVLSILGPASVIVGGFVGRRRS